mmetsp:Transcript_29078/g.57821  ORF Transcript_29078/g.57821 Transcript_29078/m.57821 type:complete len:471 (-) Transcript_29078:300-1712(-)
MSGQIRQDAAGFSNRSGSSPISSGFGSEQHRLEIGAMFAMDVPHERNQQRQPVERDNDKIPVNNFLLLKHIKEDPDVEGGVLLVGTFKQTVCCSQATENHDDDGNFYFPYRINEENANESNGRVTLRDGDNNGAVYETSFNVLAPLEIDTVLDYFPFRIDKATITIELGTKTNKKTKTKLHPELHLNMQAKPSNIRIQSPDEGISTHEIKSKMDRSTNYDFVTPFPKIRYYVKNKSCSKFSVTFYLVDSGFSKFVTTIVPLILVFFMNLINCLFNEDMDSHDYLGNAATFALTVVFLLGRVVTKTRMENGINTNSLYILLIFISLMLCSIPARLHQKLRYRTYTCDWKKENLDIQKCFVNPVPAQVGTCIFLFSFLIPFGHFMLYFKKKREIRNGSPPKEFFDQTTSIIRYKCSKPNAAERYKECFKPAASLIEEGNQIKGYVVEEKEAKIRYIRYMPLSEYIPSLEKKY